jgi:ATP-binding cassette, subfamily B (MDR/TAP), member 1
VQRLGIARALIKDAPILILDEATAALDSMTERDIQATVESRCAGKTIIRIADRLSTIRHADKVIVMGQGKVLEEGSYAELLDRDGHFARMVRQQDIGSHSRASTMMSSSSLLLAVSKVDDALDADSGEVPAGTIEFPMERTPFLSSALGTVAPVADRGPTTLLQIFPRIARLARSKRRYLIARAFFSILAGVSAPINAVVFGNMVGMMSPCHGWRQLLTSSQYYGCAFLGLAL